MTGGSSLDASSAAQQRSSERRSVIEEIRLRLTRAIESGELALGERLPPERVLSERFGVARTSIREAVHGLLYSGVLVRRGSRVHVVEHLPEVDFESTSSSRHLEELFEVRQVIEVPATQFAAERATPEERAEILEAARGFKASMSVAEFQRQNREFHWAIAKAAHNPLLSELFGKVLDALAEAEQSAWPAEGTRAARRITSRSATDHKAIARAIQSGDAKWAGSLAEAHLYEMERSSITESR